MRRRRKTKLRSLGSFESLSEGDKGKGRRKQRKEATAWLRFFGKLHLVFTENKTKPPHVLPNLPAQPPSLPRALLRDPAAGAGSSSGGIRSRWRRGKGTRGGGKWPPSETKEPPLSSSFSLARPPSWASPARSGRAVPCKTGRQCETYTRYV